LVENDVDALAKGITKLLSDPQRKKRFSNNALKKAATFDVHRLGKQLLDVYEQAIQDKKENQFVTLRSDEASGQQAISPTQA
jgi:glycosyltransferase involved in cell wall biosynthesis